MRIRYLDEIYFMLFGCWRMPEIKFRRCFVGCFAVLCASCLVLWRGVNVSFFGGDASGLSDSCHQHALHQVHAYIWGWRNVNMLLWSKEVNSRFELVEWCMQFEECLPSLGCAFFSCAFTVNVIGLLFLRFSYEISCLLVLVPNTVESTLSGVGFGGEKVMQMHH